MSQFWFGPSQQEFVQWWQLAGSLLSLQATENPPRHCTDFSLALLPIDCEQMSQLLPWSRTEWQGVWRVWSGIRQGSVRESALSLTRNHVFLWVTLGCHNRDHGMFWPLFSKALLLVHLAMFLFKPAILKTYTVFEMWVKIESWAVLPETLIQFKIESKFLFNLFFNCIFFPPFFLPSLPPSCPSFSPSSFLPWFLHS